MSNILVKVDIIAVGGGKKCRRHVETKIVRLHRVDVDVNKLSANLKREIERIEKE